MDATEEQKVRVSAILGRTAPEVYKLHSEGQTLRDQFRSALAADSIDRAAVRELQRAGLALTERAFQITVGALVEISDLLTPAQRRELLEVWSSRR